MVSKRPCEDAGGNTTHKKTTFDYSLPDDFKDLLKLPIDEAVSSTFPRSSIIGSATSSLSSLTLNSLEAVGSTISSIGGSTKAASVSSANDTSSPFINAMRTIPDARTENAAFAFKDTGSALVDLFYEFTPGVGAERMFELLKDAWKVDPISTLRIIFHARSIHEGKGFKEGFFRAMAWVWENHPLTFLANLHLITDPTCIRHRSTKRDLEKAHKDADKNESGVLELDDEGEVTLDAEGKPQYPPRPHGSFKDLVDLLILHINGQLTTSYTESLTAIDEALAPAKSGKHFKAARIAGQDGAHNKGRQYSRLQKTVGVYSPKPKPGAKPRRERASRREEELLNAGTPLQKQMVQCDTKKARHDILNARLFRMLNNDGKFRALYLTVIDLFAKAIRNDLSLYEKHKSFLAAGWKDTEAKKGRSPHLFGISYAAKWVPTPAHGADRQLHFATALFIRLAPQYDPQDGREYLQGKILSPLRKLLKVPEVNMVKGTWKIDYTKVPARAMSRNSQNFMIHDPKGFEGYLNKVATGRYAISGASLFPHELLGDAVGNNDIKSRLANLQWESLVDSIKSSSSSALTNCLAVADVSGSMGYFGSHIDPKHPQPIHVCIALTLLLGELANPPWNGCFFTFSSDPTCEFIDTQQSLSDRAKTLSQAHWEMSTAFYKIFDLILNTAKKNKLPEEQMIKKLFVFSDLQFDQAIHGKYGDTEYETAKKKFDKAGYPMPEIVFWNLAMRGDSTQPTNKPVQHSTPGVSLLSGYSGALMKMFLKQEEGNESDEDSDIELVEGKESPSKPVGATTTTKVKKVKNPLKHLMSTIGAECFTDVKVVD